ncbi:MAG: potassium channel family protein [Methanobacteriaceae archaeon]|uniref:Potassium channel protein n=2 Tax=Methanothermobacter tenebrarum TaxID=680118 RepID=A0A328PGV3_9EURY|nr:potassium channel family protein [Methanothermobacter tenebrarum]NPV65422.1 potassium channel family protein [Methanobacteriaceae archaeon]RAO78876.1 potassium channel protein [Methanothermobacter tenebrarum]
MSKASVKDILIEMKNLSELMVDLAYSALLFNSRDAAEEVKKLENKVNRLNYEIKKESLLAARSVEDAEELTALLEVGQAAENIADAAKDIAELVLKGIKPHPVFKMVMEESDEIIMRVTIEEGSELIGKSLGEILLGTRTGMRIIAIRRGESWIYGPDRNTVLAEEDTLIAKGNEAGAELLRKLAKNEMSLDEL